MSYYIETKHDGWYDEDLIEITEDDKDKMVWTVEEIEAKLHFIKGEQYRNKTAKMMMNELNEGCDFITVYLAVCRFQFIKRFAELTLMEINL